jgi:hypothetical protein
MAHVMIYKLLVEVAHIDTETKSYLKKGIYLSYGKIIKMTELTDERHCDHGIKWKCGSYECVNLSSVAICGSCYTNKSKTIITALSCIPVFGMPFSIADAILQCGKATESNKTVDNIDAGVTTIFAVIDIVTAPFIVGSLVKIPAKVAAEHGIQFTVKTIFSQAGGSLLKECGKELGKNRIIQGVKVTKGTGRHLIKEIK